jgi:hypothetical protein
VGLREELFTTDSAPDSPQFKAWQANDAVAPIAAQADVLFPSIYTFYPDENGWQTYAIAQIKEARRIGPGKPVYVFLWPQFEDATQSHLRTILANGTGNSTNVCRWGSHMGRFAANLG